MKLNHEWVRYVIYQSRLLITSLVHFPAITFTLFSFFILCPDEEKTTG